MMRCGEAGAAAYGKRPRTGSCSTPWFCPLLPGVGESPGREMDTHPIWNNSAKKRLNLNNSLRPAFHFCELFLSCSLVLSGA